MNKEQYELSRNGILRFCHLVTTPKFRESVEYLDLHRNLLEEECQELEDASDDTEKLDAFCDIVVIASQALISPHATEDEKVHWNNKISEIICKAGQGVMDLYGALLEVNRSNMTKVPLLSDVKDYYTELWHDGACSWIEENSKYTGVYGKTIFDPVDNKYRVVFKGDTEEVKGKVLKPWCFSEPDLTPFMPKRGHITLTEEEVNAIFAGKSQVTVSNDLANKLIDREKNV